MKVFQRDLAHGLIKAKPESVDDLWYLSQLIRAGDQVSSVTTRRIKDKDDSLRGGGGERKTIKLALSVEKTEFKVSEKTLRVSGTVSAGPSDIVTLGSHHTLGIQPGEVLSIVKEKWLSSELSRLKDAIESSAKPKFIIVAVEDGEANLALVRASGMEYIDLAHSLGGKYEIKGRQDRLTDFHLHLAKAIEQADSTESSSKIILCGPAFFKDDFFSYLKTKNQALSAKIVVENTGAGSRNAVKEVLNRPVVQKITEDASVGKDIQLVQKLLAEIGRDTGLFAYALPDVKNAIDSGAVETLLISTDFFMEKREIVDRLLNDVKNSSAAFHIVNSEEEPGRELDSLGGVAAILRYRIQ